MNRADTLGNLERAAIDLFRLPLLTKLGSKYDPFSLDDERKIWGALESSFSTLDREEGPGYQRAPVAGRAPTHAQSGNDGDAVELTVIESTKSFMQRRFPMAEIELQVTKPSPGLSVREIMVSDALPIGWTYLAGTAPCSGGTIAVTGTAPFAATIQLAGHSNTILIHYRVQAWKAGNV